MIAKLHRFHGFTSLRLVYSRGQTVRSSALAIRYLLNTKRTSYRAAVVVSRKVHKSAVVRNRIRRRIYEIIRGLEPRMTGPYDLVVSVFSEQLAAMPELELRALIIGQCKKAGILRAAGPAATTSGSAPSTATATPARGRAIVEPKE
jgi:ribonuclease P protein component